MMKPLSNLLVGGITCLLSNGAFSAPVTDPDDPRSWQGATVGTFAELYFGADTPANRQQVIDNQMLDDGLFDASTGVVADLIKCVGCISGGGTSLDLTGTGGYDYSTGGLTLDQAGDGVDNLWLQTGNVVGDAVWDLGASAPKAAIFNTIDHGPLPQEAIEATVYLSNNMIDWQLAVTERVWLEGFMTNTGILWDGFTYSVGTADNTNFRYASIIWGGPGALISDGDNEINGVMALGRDFEPVPEPGLVGLMLGGLLGLGLSRRKKIFHA